MGFSIFLLIFLVVGGLIGEVTLSKAGLAPAGLYEKKKVYINGGESLNLGTVNGFLALSDPYSWGGFSLYWITFGNIAILRESLYESGYLTCDATDNSVILHNNNANRREYNLYIQRLPYS